MASRTDGPDPAWMHPMHGFPRVCFIKNHVKNPRIIVGDYTYYDDPEDSENFERNVLYHFDFIGDRLIIGRFCAIATGVKFIMNGANHRMSGISTFPFGIFANGWETAIPTPGDLPFKGDTVVGNDVWFGRESVVMPGVHIGDGAIIAAYSVVTKDVPPYSIAGGNPARVIRERFLPDVAARLQAIAWWDWPVDRITRNLALIVGGDVDALERVGQAAAVVHVPENSANQVEKSG
jgi:virginiamycin A acetyltransferase